MSTSNAENEALILIHLSSLDGYTWECGGEAGEALASNLIAALPFYPGPIVVVDPQRRLIGKESAPRAQVLECLQGLPQAQWFPHDEITDGWDRPMERLRQSLLKQNITHLHIGGVWATQNGARGCVNEAMRHLRQHFACYLDRSLCGFEPS